MSLSDHVKFDKTGLIPAIIYDAADRTPLTLCYMNREALEKTVQTGTVHVFRRSKGRIMLKGETSGHIQEVKEVRVDCEGNSLAIGVRQHVAACHAGYKSCYYRVYDAATDGWKIDGERVFDPDAVYR